MRTICVVLKRITFHEIKAQKSSSQPDAIVEENLKRNHNENLNIELNAFERNAINGHAPHRPMGNININEHARF